MGWLLLVLPVPGWASATIVRQGFAQSQSTSNLVVSLPGPASAGDFIVVDTVMTAIKVTSVSGGGVTTWTQVASTCPDAGVCGFAVEMWYGQVTTGGSIDVTVNYSNGDNCLARVSELAGVADVNPFDNYGLSNSATGTQVTPGTVKTSNPTDILWATAAWGQTGPSTGPTGGFDDAGVDAQTGTAELASAFLDVNMTGLYTTTWTPMTASQSDGIIAAFKEAVSGPDSGSSLDGGSTQDAGSTHDAGSIQDAGPPDSGAVDAGSMASDSGPADGGSDAATLGPDAGPAPDGGSVSNGPPQSLGIGCDCTQVPGVCLAALVAFALVTRRRRRS